MPEITIALALSSFVAGVLMFLAPCTLPLVPAYLAFISGVDVNKSKTNGKSKRVIVRSAFYFVLGFTLVFVVFGVLAGFFGQFIGPLRDVFIPLGGAFIIMFGLMMLGVFNLSFLSREKKLPVPDFVQPGHGFGSFFIGSTFALGWTPCVGPVLASVLLLATTTTTVYSGALLLFIFSLGMALPFMLTALLYSSASKTINKYSGVAVTINKVGAVLLIVVGLLLLTNSFGLIVDYGYTLYEQLGFDRLYNLF